LIASERCSVLACLKLSLKILSSELILFLESFIFDTEELDDLRRPEKLVTSDLVAESLQIFDKSNDLFRVLTSLVLQ
jgi:hypothetical protein